MPIQGVSGSQAAPSLFSSQQTSPSSSAESAEQTSAQDAGKTGSVQQQAQVDVLKDQLETQEQTTLSLIESSGLGGNIDVRA